MNDNLLILGGTGFVGRSVCGLLVDRSGGGSAQIVVPSRRPERAKHLQLLPTVRLAPADVHDEAQLTALLRGRDAVINLVAILHGNEAAFERAHVALPRTLAKACAAAGVKRVVHVSALGVGPEAPSRYLRSKTAGEAALLNAGLDLTTLRPSVIFGEHDRFLNLFAQLQAVFPVMPLAGADARFQPVWVQDVAAAIVKCLDDDSAIGKTYELAGPQVLTLKQLVQAAGRYAGHARPVIGLPDALGKLQALAMELLPGAPLMSRDNLASMRTPNVASGKLPGLAQLGITPATLASIAPDYLSPGRGVARLDRWRARRGG
ncbi:MAG: complex I NDUFA9 subunit family protein [Burkholderiales bacterium]